MITTVKRGRPRRYDYDEMGGQLYDALAALPAEAECDHGIRGMDIYEIQELLAAPAIQCHATIRHLRLLFGSDDEVGLPCHSCHGRRHLYHLTASLEMADAWVQTRLKAQMSQLDTMIAFWQAMARAHDASTVDGQMARLNIMTFSEARSRLELMVSG